MSTVTNLGSDARFVAGTGESDIFLVRRSLQLRCYRRKSAVMRLVVHRPVVNFAGLREVSFGVKHSL